MSPNKKKKISHSGDNLKYKSDELHEDKNKSFLQNKKEIAEFKYGNYHQYYGYRNQGSSDSRLNCMKSEWFQDKDILDIGCNAGHFTLSIATNFKPKSIVGIDIDGELVKMAMKNIRHYVTSDNIYEGNFPLSLPLSYGPVAQSLDPKQRYSCAEFPFNVQFLKANYIVPNEKWLEQEEPLFDTILCLSLTKWVHLNWGDLGIRRLFQRIYKQLQFGGHLILEAQTFQSYAKRKKLAEELYKNYKEIKLFPEMFNEYLIKEVGFESCELIDIPHHESKGFSRPIYLFTKRAPVCSVSPAKKSKHIIYDSSSEKSYDSNVEKFSDSD